MIRNEKAEIKPFKTAQRAETTQRFLMIPHRYRRHNWKIKRGESKTVSASVWRLTTVITYVGCQRTSQGSTIWMGSTRRPRRTATAQYTAVITPSMSPPHDMTSRCTSNSCGKSKRTVGSGLIL